MPLSNEAKVLYAFILRRTDLSRKNGWVDEYGRIYLYYPINEVVELLHCGRQKACLLYTSPVMPSTAQEVDDDSEMDDRTRRLIAGALSAFRSRG